MLIGIRPTDDAYDANNGAVFHPQDENDGGNVAYYEIQNTTDEIQFDVREDTAGLSNPILILNSIFGPTDFSLVDRNTGEPIVAEQSGFDSDVWTIDISEASGRFSITNFNTGNGVDGTQAGWYAYITVAPLI